MVWHDLANVVEYESTYMVRYDLTHVARHDLAHVVMYDPIHMTRSELSSYTSSVGSRKCYGIGLSCTSETKGDPGVELSLSSSFDLTNSFWTSFIYWFINIDCACSESVESEERVFGSSMLRIEVLVVGVYRPVAFPMGAGRCSGGGCGTLSLGCSGVKGCLAKGGASCDTIGVV
ncbi:hypothetical protein B296_00012288 [Ensete ventricosum]|uniref:Uncharacterized protein n=1 Tax=Ensete ventricosum TaxID=4639 RepID=A0A426YPG5_ENSVE|nr:hypothetical protein B296_00012288 [Ensete ventricosum]